MRASRVERVRAIFGIDDRRSGPPAGAARAARELDEALGPGSVALVTGPSGAGKSAILRELARAIRRRGGRVTVAEEGRLKACPTGRAVIDLFRCGMGRAMMLLARAGLAEAGVMVRRASQLSDGQRARLAIALAMARIGSAPAATLIIDEFASTLDRPAAMCLARTVRRWARAAGVRMVCASAHDDILEALGPDVLVEQGLGREAAICLREAA